LFSSNLNATIFILGVLGVLRRNKQSVNKPGFLLVSTEILWHFNDSNYMIKTEELMRIHLGLYLGNN
jgi:hypothetical protein